MSFTVFLGNLPLWVTDDDIKSWLTAESLVYDKVKVIRNMETQESKGFAFIDTPNNEEMNSIIRRFDRAPLDERLLRANQAQPPKGKVGLPVKPPASSSPSATQSSAPATAVSPAAQPQPERMNRRGGKSKPKRTAGPQSAFAEELAKAL
jgi:RNA recognition motif-containing protein